jgi:hypothetical protein
VLNPLLVLLIALSLALLFAHAGWLKRADGSRFTAQLAAYRLLSARWLPLVAAALPVLELSVALLLLWPATRAAAGTCAALLLAVYALAIGINLRRGRAAIDCGCGGPPQPLSWWLVLRNLLLAAVALLLSLPAAPRALAAGDFALLAALCVLLLLAWAAAGQLLRNRALLAGWRAHES